MSMQVEAKILSQYLSLCRNPLRPDAMVQHEFEVLKHHLRVTNIGFYQDILVVSTDMITIVHQGVRHEIGEFLIFVIRRPDGNYWKVDFRFRNLTQTKPYQLSSHTVLYHPHIKSVCDNVLDYPNGSLCINSGQFGIYQSLRKGEMHQAIPALIAILEIYPTGIPFQPVEKWSVKEV